MPQATVGLAGGHDEQCQHSVCLGSLGAAGGGSCIPFHVDSIPEPPVLGVQSDTGDTLLKRLTNEEIVFSAFSPTVIVSQL